MIDNERLDEPRESRRRTARVVNLGAQMDDAWEEMVAGWRFSDDVKDTLTVEYARARARQIGDWADRAEDLDGLTAASREGVIRRRLENERRQAA